MKKTLFLLASSILLIFVCNQLLAAGPMWCNQLELTALQHPPIYMNTTPQNDLTFEVISCKHGKQLSDKGQILMLSDIKGGLNGPNCIVEIYSKSHKETFIIEVSQHYCLYKGGKATIKVISVTNGSKADLTYTQWSHAGYDRMSQGAFNFNLK